MEKFKISFVELLPKEIKDKMETGLEEYETTHRINVNYKPFALVLFNEKNKVIGAMEAFTSYSSIHINDMWIDKSHHSNGYGRKMIASPSSPLNN